MPLAATATEASPLAFVVAVPTSFTNSAFARLAGSVNITTTPLTGFPRLSVTVATSGAANSAPAIAVCGVPLVAVIDAAVDGPVWPPPHPHKTKIGAARTAPHNLSLAISEYVTREVFNQAASYTEFLSHTTAGASPQSTRTR
jgi:hypothetical protein